MSEITAEMVMQLREATNLGMMECKKALAESGGDKEKAIRLLREKGMAFAQKRADRAANQGVIASVVRDGKVASLVELNCETDFVAKNASFIEFAKQLADAACDTDGSLAEMKKADLVAKIQTTGENLVIRRNTRFCLSGAGTVASYIHLGGKIGVLVEVGCGKGETAANPVFAEAVRDVAMHIAASNPGYLAKDQVSQDIITAEREIYAKQITGKPANIVDKIVDGKLRKFFSDVCLVDQPFVKEPKISVSQMLADRGKAVNDTIAIKRFVRYQLGQSA